MDSKLTNNQTSQLRATTGPASDDKVNDRIAVGMAVVALARHPPGGDTVFKPYAALPDAP